MGTCIDVGCHLPACLVAQRLASHAPHLGLAAAREAAKKKIQDAKFEPKNTELGEPKEGDHDDKEHSGGNKWAGGVCFRAFETK